MVGKIKGSREKRRFYRGGLIALALWLNAVVAPLGFVAQDEPQAHLENAQAAAADTQGGASTNAALAAPFPSTSAAAAIVINRDTGVVLGSKNPDTLRPNPSTTKIMTALIAIERNAANLDSIVGPVSAKSANTYGSTMNLEAGDTVSLRDLLYGLMLPSGNDAGVAIAEWISGNESAFVSLMNDRAASLGLNNTAYRNSFGYDPVELPAQCVSPYSGRFNCGHYTTARDLATLSRIALRQPTFARIVQTTVWTPSSWLNAAKTRRSLALRNDNLLLSSIPYSGANGVKTGMSTSAGFCMVASATRGGNSLLAVVMGCASDHLRHVESQKLLDWGFSQVGSMQPPSLATISVSAMPMRIARGGDATFVISRSQPDSTQPTTVRYAMSGTARLGTDYSLSGTVGEADIPAGASSTQVVLHAFNSRARVAKRATLQLSPSTSYNISAANNATVTIKRRR